MSDVRVVPLESFTGYPDGIRTRFEAGVSIPVPPAYATILRDKDLVEKTKGKKSAPDAADE